MIKKIGITITVVVLVIAAALGSLFAYFKLKDKGDAIQTTKASGDFVLYTTDGIMYGTAYELSEDIDTAFLLYLKQKMTEEEFLNQLYVLQLEAFSLQGIYYDHIASYTIEDNSTSYYAERGFAAIEHILSAFNAVLVDTSELVGQPNSLEQIAYVYAAYQDDYKEYMLEYGTALTFMSELFSSEIENAE